MTLRAYFKFMFILVEHEIINYSSVVSNIVQLFINNPILDENTTLDFHSEFEQHFK